MMRNKLIIFALIFFTTITAGSGVPANTDSQKKEKLRGTVIAYEHWSALTGSSNTLNRMMLIVRVDKSNNQSSGALIQVAYRYYSIDIPSDLMSEKRQWQFKLKRDRSCDNPIQEFVRVEDINTKETKLEQLAAWRYVSEAEKEKIPFGTTLPCYSLEYKEYKPYKK